MHDATVSSLAPTKPAQKRDAQAALKLTLNQEARRAGVLHWISIEDVYYATHGEMRFAVDFEEQAGGLVFTSAKALAIAKRALAANGFDLV